MLVGFESNADDSELTRKQERIHCHLIFPACALCQADLGSAAPYLTVSLVSLQQNHAYLFMAYIAMRSTH